MCNIIEKYNANVGRCDYLRIEIEETERALNELETAAINYEAVPGVQQLTGMPHGGKIGRPTEEVAIMFASGDVPRYMSEMRDSLKAMQKEYRKCVANVKRAEAWLKSLKDRERWVVTKQMIEGLSWRELSTRYENLYGEPRSKRCLQIIKKRAILKIAREKW